MRASSYIGAQRGITQVCGFLAIITLMVAGLEVQKAGQVSAAKQQIAADAALSVAGLEAQRAKDDAANQLGVDVSSSIRFTNFDSSVQPFQLEWLSVVPDGRVILYDLNGICIGYAYAGHLYTQQNDPTACHTKIHDESHLRLHEQRLKIEAELKAKGAKS
jgi:hypothetical protein